MMTASYSPIRCLELLSRYAQQPSITLRNELVKMNTGLVRRVAHQLSRQCVEPYEDLEQVGFLGLIRAIERFEPKQGTAFSSFAIPYIRGEMLHYLRDKSSVLRIPRRWQELHSKGKSVSKQLARQLERPPTAQEIANALSIPIAEWQECQSIFKQRFLVSLDRVISPRTPSRSTNSDSNSLTFLETLPEERWA
ncbi:MAG: sigma-70 family RNA polymerase sigma factor, partial [Synechocystis sp.]